MDAAEKYVDTPNGNDAAEIYKDDNWGASFW